MREILFRGKHKQDKEWLQGDFHRGFISGGAFINGFEVDPSTVGQYTGLNDKNGNKIFEGDIVKFHCVIGIVCFDKRTASFYYEVPHDGSSSQHLGASELGEVIGNIYDK